MRMGNLINRTGRQIAICMMAAMLFVVLPMHVKAAEAHKFNALGNGRYQLEGTNVVFEVSGQNLHVTGSGEIPDFDYWELESTPWAKAQIVAITVDGSITSIGKYVFSNPDKADFQLKAKGKDGMETADGIMNNLKYVTLSTTTFIKDWTTFNKSGQRVIFRIQSNGVTTEMIGSIPYTSMDSLKAFAQSAATGTSFLFDTHVQASEFQNSTNPTIDNVFAATDIVDNTAPWTNLDKYHNGGVYVPLAEMKPNPGYIVTSSKKYQGRACYEAFAAYIGDYTLGCAYNINVTDKSAARNKIMKTDQTSQFTITIPENLRKSGRTFKLIGLTQETAGVLENINVTGSTITIQTNYPTATYGLIYKD